MSNGQEHNPFWQYSLSLYRRPEIQECCLAAQDQYGMDVNLLLFCCWLAEQKRILELSCLKLNSELQKWQGVILPTLRQARRAIGAIAKDTLYEDAKTLELKAEHRVQMLLWQTHQEHPLFDDDHHSAIDNLSLYWQDLSDAPLPPPLVSLCRWMKG